MRKNNLFTGVFSSFLDVLFPPRCALCRKKSAEVLCPPCRGALPLRTPPFCFHCGKSLHAQNASYPHCSDCRGQKRALHFDAARAAGVYEGSFKQLIHALKYEKKKSLAPVLTDILISFLTGDAVNAFPASERKTANEDFLFPEIKNLNAVTYVPMDAKKQRQRGFNQSELLARAFSERANIPFVHGLRKIKTTRAQVNLSEKERWENMKSVFDSIEARRQDIADKKILLVDDVLTTGATASACSQVLKKNGALNVFVATIANTS